ncbi:MAG TPA: hypothetical protein ENJ53_00375 [Phaeodactylibacter sp.]|nr:hypothetical protein [Phaeodactylibacter sp.]
MRQLGPGSYVDTAAIRTGDHYQTGDFKLEMNLEYRFNIVGYLKGAIFLDAGNIWTLGKDERKGSGVDNFFNKIAVGSGIGFRFDVEYVVFRFDLGYKLRNPFPDENNQYWQVHRLKDLALNKFLGSLSVGYPF